MQPPEALRTNGFWWLAATLTAVLILGLCGLGIEAAILVNRLLDLTVRYAGGNAG